MATTPDKKDDDKKEDDTDHSWWYYVKSVLEWTPYGKNPVTVKILELLGLEDDNPGDTSTIFTKALDIMKYIAFALLVGVGIIIFGDIIIPSLPIVSYLAGLLWDGLKNIAQALWVVFRDIFGIADKLLDGAITVPAGMPTWAPYVLVTGLLGIIYYFTTTSVNKRGIGGNIYRLLGLKTGTEDQEPITNNGIELFGHFISEIISGVFWLPSFLIGFVSTDAKNYISQWGDFIATLNDTFWGYLSPNKTVDHSQVPDTPGSTKISDDLSWLDNATDTWNHLKNFDPSHPQSPENK